MVRPEQLPFLASLVQVIVRQSCTRTLLFTHSIKVYNLGYAYALHASADS